LPRNRLDTYVVFARKPDRATPSYWQAQTELVFPTQQPKPS
jgi:hypothetical protein